MCFVRLIQRVVCIWWCKKNDQHTVRTNGWAMHEATCLKNVHVTSDIKEHVTQWSIWDEKIWPISWGSWIHVIWRPIVRFLDRYINWLGPRGEKLIRWVLLDRSPKNKCSGQKDDGQFSSEQVWLFLGWLNKLDATTDCGKIPDKNSWHTLDAVSI